MPAHDVAKVPDAPHLDQDNPLGSASQRESSLEYDIGARLGGGPDFRVILSVRIFRAQCDDFVRGPQHDDCLGSINRSVDYLADVRAGLPRGGDGLGPLNRSQPDRPQEREDREARGAVPSVHHINSL